MDRIQLRRDTSNNWKLANPILLEGEIGYETDTKLRKIGDGVNHWNDLDYLKLEDVTNELGNSKSLAVSQDLFTKLHNEGYKIAGIANLDTIPQNVTADSKIYYIANTPGTYTNFNNIVVADGEIAFLTYNGSWRKITLSVLAQELGDREDIGVSQKCVTEKMTELESKTNENDFNKANIKVGKNKLNPLSCKPNTYINAKNGAEGIIEGCFATWYIPIDGQNLYCNNIFSGGSTIGWAAYDENQNFIRGDYIFRDRYTYQEGDVYVRFSISTLENTQVEIGTTSTEYEPFNPIAGWGISDLKESKLNKQNFKDAIYGYKTIPNAALQLIGIRGNLTPLLITLQEGKYINAINDDETLSYMNSEKYTTFLLPVDGTSTYLFDSARFFVLMKDFDHAINNASVGKYGNSIDSMGAKFIALTIDTEEYPLESYKIGVGSLVEKTEYCIPNFNLDDKSVEIEKLAFASVGKNKFNIDDKDCRLGGYLTNNEFVISDAYNVTGYIKVKPNTTYQCSCNGDIKYGEYLARFLCQYNENKDHIEGADLQPPTSTNQFTTGAATHFVRITVRSSFWEKYQVEEGVSPTAWEKYRLVIEEDALPTIQPSEKIFERLHKSADLTNGQTLTLPQNFVRKNIAFSVKIHRDTLTGLNVLMGLGYNAYTGGWLELTDTKLKVHHYTQSDVVAAEYDHNITLGKDIVILFDGEIENATIKIISNGQIFSQEINRNSYFAGAGFVTNLGSNAINAEMNVIPKDINQKIWLYGDSYLGYLNPERWLTYMLEWGFNSWMSDSRPGGNSAEGYVSMTTDLTIGKPKYILWLNGMNDGGDPDANTPSTTWMNNLEKVLSVIGEDITLILATIPSVPTINHEAKNAWVRNSGYRYIDFANAVGADANGTWIDGMLHADGVHPTNLGAKALASQVLIDFPEIMVKL